MRKRIAIGTTALLVGVGLIFPVAAAAYQGDSAVQGPNYTVERHEAMKKAFETKDFAAWKALMNGRGRVSQVINESNFARFAEAHKLAEQGKTEEAAKIRQELGLSLRNGADADSCGGSCDQPGTGSGGRWSR